METIFGLVIGGSVVHELSGLESFKSGGASSPSPLESAQVSWRLEGLGGSEGLGGCRPYVGTVVVPRAQVHTDQEKIFTGGVDTW